MSKDDAARGPLLPSRPAPPEYRLRPDALEHEADALLLARLLYRRVPFTAALLARYGGWAGLARVGTRELMDTGLTIQQAERLRLALEIGRRLPLPPALPHHVLAPPDVIALLPMEQWAQEQLWVVLLTASQAVIAVEPVDVGQGMVHPAEVLRSAVRRHAAAMVVVQRGSADDLRDVDITRQLVVGGALLGIVVVDHLVVSGTRWRSLRERWPGMWR